ncbi:MAG: YqeG family HAD IIIA-type phosphatase [Oscillospiraceae bacterium]|jgi:HAD superfamily phosphatase (TIGR01668 family)|nr:YqeG family HAD IIIA-type phosphatase [Oscillospiraceae bacterium]
MGLLLPRLFLENITFLTPEMLQRRGISALALDVDNTLARPKIKTPFPGVCDWLVGMKAAGIKLVIVSNALPKRVRPLAEDLGLPFISLACKPFPIALFRAEKKLGAGRKQLALAGDQVFTDTLAAKLAGVFSVLVRPGVPEKHWIYRLKRQLESRIIKRYVVNQKKNRF